MLRRIAAFVAVSVLALVGDPTDLWRFSVFLLAGCLAVVLAYWLWPATLPLWPGAIVVAASAILGVFWEYSAGKSKSGEIR